VKKKNDDDSQLALAGTEEAEILARLSERVEKAVATKSAEANGSMPGLSLLRLPTATRQTTMTFRFEMEEK